MAVFFAFAALASAPAGRMADRIGARRALRVGLGLEVVALTLMAVATSWWQLPAALAVAGLGHAILQVGSNLLLANDVAPRVQGLAFGIKQSAIPAATLIAGASVPILGTQFGWRWAYGAAALVAALVLVLQGRRRDVPVRAARRPALPTVPRANAFTRRELILLAVAVGLGSGAANTLPPFLVAFAVESEMPVGRAGVMLATASGVGLAARVLIGALADVRGSAEIAWVATMLVVGGLAFAGISFGRADAPLLWVAGSAAFAGGWGWPGLFTFIVARENAHQPASATGLTQTGVFIGAVAGPLLFGLTVSSLSYETAWLGAAVAQLLGAALLLVARGTRRTRLRRASSG